MEVAQKLSNLQLELIKVFSQQLDEVQLFEIRDLLSNYFAEKATHEMDRLWTENNWNNKTIDVWADEHIRTPIKD